MAHPKNFASPTAQLMTSAACKTAGTVYIYFPGNCPHCDCKLRKEKESNIECTRCELTWYPVSA